MLIDKWEYTEDDIIDILVSDSSIDIRRVFDAGKQSKGEGNLRNNIMSEDHLAHIDGHWRQFNNGDTAEDHLQHIQARIAMYHLQQRWLREQREATPVEELVADEYSPRNDAIPY